MFGFSLSKLVVLVAIIAAVWYGFKFLGRLDEKRKAEIKRGAAKGHDAEAMVECPVCGIYVSAQDAGNCGRADCPY